MALHRRGIYLKWVEEATLIRCKECQIKKYLSVTPRTPDALVNSLILGKTTSKVTITSH